jgi:Ca2+-transporting ATPase
MNRGEHPPWHHLEVDEVLERLRTMREGLSSEEAKRRLQRFGPNRLATEEAIQPAQILLRQMQSPLIYILIAAAVVTALLGALIDTAVILAVVVLNSALGFIQEYKAEQALRALARMAAPKARVLRDGREQDIDAQAVVPGDVVLLESGNRVPADLRLLRAVDLQADEAILTGESIPVTKQTEPVPNHEAPLGDQFSMAFSGTSVARGRGTGVTTRTGMQTAFGRISAQVRRVGEVRTPLQVRLDRFARLIAIIVLGATALVVVLGFLLGEPLAAILLTAVATAVATVPEGLPVTITVALAVGVSRMARRMAIIRKLPAVETLGSVTTICSDKTGTLTRTEMTVTRILACGGLYKVSGAGYAPEGDIRLEGQEVDLAEHPALEMALRIGTLANESAVYESEGRYQVDGDPTEGALIVAAMKVGLHQDREREEYPELDQIPFESERRYMATLHAHDSEKLIFVKGAPERILQMSEAVYVRSGALVPVAAGAVGGPGAVVRVGGAESTEPLDPGAWLEASDRFAAEGLRVLAMAYKRAPLEVTGLDHREVEAGLLFVGLQAMLDPPRPEAIDAIERTHRAGVHVAMITGDHKVTAQTIATQMGIGREVDGEVVDGHALQAMDDEELSERVKRISVFARAGPEQKLRIVQALRRRREVVAVTGDGVNDAPALKQADIGVAMGVVGTDVAKEASDMVLADDNFATIYAAIEEGRVVFDNIRKVIIFLIPTGLGLLLTVVASIALQLPLPFLPAQIIWINLVTNGLQDVAMAFEPAEEDVGLRRPRDPAEDVLTRLMVERTLLVGVILLFGTLGFFVSQLDGGVGIDQARTAAMTTMVLFQNFHVLNSRSFSRSAFRMNPLTNKVLFVAVLSALALHIAAVYWQPLQFVLRTQALPLETWLVIITLAASVLVAVEVDKAIRRWRRR